MAILIGIVAYLSNFAKKAVPVAACGLVIAMPLAGIGAVNVGSAQEDNSSTNFDSNMLLDIPGRYSPPNRDAYAITACILWEAREDVGNPSSSYSIIYNNNAFDKYLDSILKDAQKAGETGVKSLIPSPEGKVLDTITKGAYGEISQIILLHKWAGTYKIFPKLQQKCLRRQEKG